MDEMLITGVSIGEGDHVPNGFSIRYHNLFRRNCDRCFVTFYSLRFVSSPHSLNKGLVKWLGKLWGHSNMKIRFVAFQHSVQSELADCISYHL